MSATFGSCLQKPAPADQLIVAAIYVIPAPPPAYDAERVAVNPIIESLRLTLAPLITKTHAQIVCGPLMSTFESVP